MFTSLNRIAVNSPKKKRRRKNVSRKNRAFSDGRSLRMESLEERRVLTLLGVAPVGLPSIDYNVDGAVSYDATSDAFSVDATPISIMSSGNPDGFFFSGDLDINIEVDDTGALVGGSAGHDFVLKVAIDIDVALDCAEVVSHIVHASERSLDQMDAITEGLESLCGFANRVRVEIEANQQAIGARPLEDGFCVATTA